MVKALWNCKLNVYVTLAGPQDPDMQSNISILDDSVRMIWSECQTLFLGAPKSLQMVTAAMKLKDAYSLEGKLWPT